MTTPLTIYRFGLCGNSANESIGKHRFRTKKHQKANKSSQKTAQNRFGYWRPGVRISTLRPKKEREPLRFSFLFSLFGLIRAPFAQSAKELAYPVRRLACSRGKEGARANYRNSRLSTLFTRMESISLHLAILAGLSASSGRRIARRSIRV